MTDSGFLSLEWASDDSSDGTGQLFGEAASTSFAGKSEAWFNDSALLEFATRCESYPLDTKRLPSLSSGYGSGDEMMTTLAVDIYPIGSAGQVGVRVQLASWYSTFPADRPLARCGVELEVLSSYNELRRLAEQLRHAVQAGGGRARLAEDRFA